MYFKEDKKIKLSEFVSEEKRRIIALYGSSMIPEENKERVNKKINIVNALSETVKNGYDVEETYEFFSSILSIIEDTDEYSPDRIIDIMILKKRFSYLSNLGICELRKVFDHNSININLLNYIESKFVNKTDDEFIDVIKELKVKVK